MLKQWLEIHKNEMVEDIRQLVEIPSIAETANLSEKEKQSFPFGRECAMTAQTMKGIAEKYGFKVQNCAGRCIKILYDSEAMDRKENIEIWNHLDVVPSGNGWIYPPFRCTVKNDFLIGRGVSDNKGPAIAVLYALRYLKEQGIRFSYALSQICGLSEEVGMQDAAWYVGQYGSASLALIADCRFPLCYGEKGRCIIELGSVRFLPHIRALSAGSVSNSVAEQAELQLEIGGRLCTLKAKGVSGHAAAPEKCVNPIGILAEMVESRKDLQLTEDERIFFDFLKKSCSDGYGMGLKVDEEDRIFGKMTCQGTVLRMEAGKAFLTFDLRFSPEADLERILMNIGKTAESYGWKVETADYANGYIQNMEAPYIKELLSAYESIYGKTGSPYVMGGNTYARFFQNAVGFGPGIPRSQIHDSEQEEKVKSLGLPPGHGGGHGCDEVQSLEGLCKAVEIYVEALKRLENIYGGSRTKNGT